MGPLRASPTVTRAPERDLTGNGQVPGDVQLTVRRLELHGYKTFASPTTFEFDDGITVIVGPNGSGKSNITDAIRWVLGEQRISVLRAKKSEDMIFSGTDRRARMGMAQVFLTLDNADRSLPIDFSEVVIGRRAYRSGENEYLLNGNKVRLRDIQELLAHVGVGTNTYTVIGQGLVDAALSLRADERRQMIEDAAGLGAYQGKRSDALRKLEETEENLRRVKDIVSELKPRLGRLRRQAEKAEEHAELTEQLRELLRQWYGYRWSQTNQALIEARRQVERTTEEAAAAHKSIQAAERQLAQLRQREASVREQLEELHRERQRYRTQAEQLRRERAVAAERATLLERQAGELATELEELVAEEARLAERGTALRADRSRLEAKRADAETQLEAVRERLRTAEQRRTALREQLDTARRAQGRITARSGELQQEQSQLTEREEQLEQELNGHRAALTDLEAQTAHNDGETRLLEEELETLHRQRAELLDEQQHVRATLTDARAHQETCEDRFSEVERELSKLDARRDLLARLREEGSGFQEGVRALLRSGDVDGIVAPIVETLRVPERLSLAISAALNSELQTVIVTDLDAADQARRWLQKRETGRVTLLPRNGRRGKQPLPPAPNDTPSGRIVGRAAELVPAEDPIILEHVLGDWLIVENWPTAVEIARNDTWHIVTLDGEVLRRDGAIQAGRGDGGGRNLLAQSREWAELPKKIASLQREQKQAQAALDAAEETVYTLEDELQSLQHELGEVDRSINRTTAGLERQQREAERLEQEQTWRTELTERLRNNLATLEVRSEELNDELRDLATQRAEVEEEVQTLEQEVEAAHPGALRETLEKARTAVALVDEQLAGLERQIEDWKASENRLARQQKAKERRAEELAAEREDLMQRRERLAAEAKAVETKLSRSSEQIDPREKEITRLETAQASQEEQLAGLRRRAQELDEAVHRAKLSRQAAEDRLEHLREQIENDLGLVEFGELDEGLPHQSMLPIDEYVTTLPKVTVLPDGVENDIRRLRRLIGRLGAINPDAPQEYAELNERHEFLTGQAADLEAAAEDLRQIVDELDQLMVRRFMNTLTAVDDAFRQYFTRLFGGGNASLELDDAEDPLESGIDIVARPPGKRPQNIALLSGGERALTAASLIFAILSVSPAPFCIMDEVDAMLDEANVGRFCDVLRELAENTQFIVITHNRGTIEAADTIYGVSQTESGVSSVLSLAVGDAIRAAKQ